MQIDTKKLNVVQNISANRFEIQVDDLIAVSQYRLTSNVISFYHVGVPPELEGQGVGSLLAKASLDFAREKSFKVIPACPFVAAYIRRHPEYQSLL